MNTKPQKTEAERLREEWLRLQQIYAAKEEALRIQGKDFNALFPVQSEETDTICFGILRYSSPSRFPIQTLFSDRPCEKNGPLWSCLLLTLQGGEDSTAGFPTDICRAMRLFVLETGTDICALAPDRFPTAAFCSWAEKELSVILSPESLRFEILSFDEFVSRSGEQYLPEDFEQNDERTPIVWYAFDEQLAEEQGYWIGG